MMHNSSMAFATMGHRMMTGSRCPRCVGRALEDQDGRQPGRCPHCGRKLDREIRFEITGPKQEGGK